MTQTKPLSPADFRKLTTTQQPQFIQGDVVVAPVPKQEKPEEEKKP